MKHGSLYGYRKGCRDDLACPKTPSCRQTHNQKGAEYKARVAAGEQVPTRAKDAPKSARHLRTGWDTEFVRWVWLGEQKVPELTRGKYIGATPTHWQIERDGRPVFLSRDEWSVCSS